MNDYQSSAPETDESREISPEIMSPGTGTGDAGSSESKARLELDDGEHLELFGNEVIIGRTDPLEDIHPDVDLGIRGGLELGVSRRHAAIFLEDGNFFLEDLGSTNGTIVNRERIQTGERIEINEGDIIFLGRFRAMFQTPEDSGGSQ